ncbi:hypothetical protein, unlikely [Trypanosoma brucei gambiense DAL972]|uniref:Uncharacterized protein n=1 Tax=Trypanosoma brucei gambiense (strain MHOM/CI/86/DAL972) TaxID=679716 RepID=C9ZMB2_TRYB9|nr:hypothetical protein, unlikely [Trypanosoma brucei gambiense DAL972]CBH10785.1 hypothetical protein, unlikely [Trypanosoma brucei gambiense DAL972]|eukprot:XP_011773073.1 hypothetical protein, unlikely [Trypanosoma brucei gambiense DAL972]
MRPRYLAFRHLSITGSQSVVTFTHGRGGGEKAKYAKAETIWANSARRRYSCVFSLMQVLHDEVINNITCFPCWYRVRWLGNLDAEVLSILKCWRYVYGMTSPSAKHMAPKATPT